MKEKDRNFIINIFELDEDGYDKLVSEVKRIAQKGEEALEEHLNRMTENLSGRDAYEVKKILSYRLD